jgi:hypothetical protein
LSGKSSFAINSFVCNPFIDAINNPNVNLKIRYYSLEVSAIRMAAKMISWLIFQKHGALSSASTYFGRGDKLLNDYYKSLLSREEEYINKFLECVEIIDKPLTPTQIKDDIRQFSVNRGKFVNVNGKQKYIPNDENEHVIIVFDTLSNLVLEKEGDTTSRKGTIDLHSANCRHIYRNLLNYTVCNVMHSNRSMSSMNRAQFGEIAPKKEDIQDSGTPSKDANMVIAIFNPAVHMNSKNNLSKFSGYDIPRFKNKFRAIYLLKNRDGEALKKVNCSFIPQCGYFSELKLHNEMTDFDYDSILDIKETFKLRSSAT